MVRATQSVDHSKMDSILSRSALNLDNNADTLATLNSALEVILDLSFTGGASAIPAYKIKSDAL